MVQEIAGVLAAVPTPFDKDGTFVASRFIEHGEWVLDNGGDGLNVLGTTGEANSQGRESRAAVMHCAVESPLRRAPLMVGTGTPSLQETIELTTLAAELGFDGALILPPYYYKGVSDEGLFQYFDAVIRAVGGNDIRVYLYNFPQMTGISFSGELIERLLAAHPRQFAGMKDSSGDLEYTNRIADQFHGRFDVFPGSEGPLADAMTKHYAGCISASVNATVPFAARIWRNRNGVSPQDAEQMREMRNAIAAFPMVAVVKTLVAMRTGLKDWRRVLPPLQPLSDTDRGSVVKLAAQFDLSSN